MINKQSLWFVTLFSLILILSIYYITMSDSNLQNILGNSTVNNEYVNAEVNESSALVALRVAEDEEVLKQMEDYQSILLDSSKTSQEKSDAYNSLMSLNTKKGKEQEMEEKIKSEFQLDSFVKIKDDTISIVISSNEHNSNLANNIIRTIQKMCDKKMYITVKFQA